MERCGLNRPERRAKGDIFHISPGRQTAPKGVRVASRNITGTDPGISQVIPGIFEVSPGICGSL